MAESWSGSDHTGSPEGSLNEKSQFEPIYEAFICPVSIDNEQDFELVAIEKWFKGCMDDGKRLTSPVAVEALNSTNLNLSIVLQDNTTKEWAGAKEAAQLEIACKSLSPPFSESKLSRALDSVVSFCQVGSENKHAVRNAGLIPPIAEMLKNGDDKVRCKALQALRILAAEDENKDAMAAAGAVRAIMKLLSHEHSQERDEAISLIYELSKSETLCEEIGGVNGAVLILVGISSSESENVSCVERAERTLENLEKCQSNVRQMAENGRLRPLLYQLLEGSPETQLSMAAYLEGLALSNDTKLFVAETAGPPLVEIIRGGGGCGQRRDSPAREAALRVLNKVSTYGRSANILIRSGILPPLFDNLFAVGGENQLPTRLKEVSAAVLANIVASGADFQSVVLGCGEHQTLVSEDVVHNLLHLISNTGPGVEFRLLQLLVGLTGSATSAASIVSAIRSSGAALSLVQFVETPQMEIRAVAVNLLHNISPYMSQELADALCGAAAGGQLGSLIKIISETNGVVSEEQAAAARLLASLPARDSVLTGRLLEAAAFDVVVSRVARMRRGAVRSNRFATPYLEGLVGVLSRLTYALRDEPLAVRVARKHDLAAVFIDLLGMNGVARVQAASASALENLSERTRHLSRIPVATTATEFCCPTLFPLLLMSRGRRRAAAGAVCGVHRGVCSAKESFCLVEGKAVEKLVACLDHEDDGVAEAALAALCTLLDDGVDVGKGVQVLDDAEGIRPVLEVLVKGRTEGLRRRAVWAAERMMRTEEIAFAVAADRRVGTALVEAFRNGDCGTKMAAELALRHVDKLPEFSAVFQVQEK